MPAHRALDFRIALDAKTLPTAVRNARRIIGSRITKIIACLHSFDLSAVLLFNLMADGLLLSLKIEVERPKSVGRARLC